MKVKHSVSPLHLNDVGSCLWLPVGWVYGLVVLLRQSSGPSVLWWDSKAGSSWLVYYYFFKFFVCLFVCGLLVFCFFPEFRCREYTLPRDFHFLPITKRAGRWKSSGSCSVTSEAMLESINSTSSELSLQRNCWSSWQPCLMCPHVVHWCRTARAIKTRTLPSFFSVSPAQVS